MSTVRGNNKTIQEKSDKQYIDQTIQSYKDKLESLEDRLSLLEARNEKGRENLNLQEEIDLLGKAIYTKMDYGEYNNTRNQIWKEWVA